MSDQELLRLCQVYGSQAKLWKQKFLGLLPEVERRRLYEHKGCSSIFEFTAKLGGVSREQVSLVLNLDQRFVSTPNLKQALVSGEVSINKLARVVSVATVENEEFLLNQSKLLSNRALETLVKDIKSLHVQTAQTNKTIKARQRANQKVTQSVELQLTGEIKKRLLELQNKGLDLNVVLSELLDQREQSIHEEKEKMRKELDQKITKASKQPRTNAGGGPRF